MPGTSLGMAVIGQCTLLGEAYPMMSMNAHQAFLMSHEAPELPTSFGPLTSGFYSGYLPVLGYGRQVWELGSSVEASPVLLLSLLESFSECLGSDGGA
jgi:hypothetical protein